MDTTSSARRALSVALGPQLTWPQALVTALAIVEAEPSPCAIVWGPERVLAAGSRFAALVAPLSIDGGAPLASVAGASPLLALLLEPAARVMNDGASISLPSVELAPAAPGARPRWLALTLVPIRTRAEGPADGALVFVEDQTARVDADARVEAVRRELHEDFEQMFGVAAHDLKNPLNVISLSSYQLAMLQLPPELKDRTKRLTDAVKRSMRRIDDLLNDLLDLAHLDVGPLVLERAPHDANKLLEEALEHLSAVAANKSVLLDTRFDPQLTVVCDKARFLRIVTNLVTDAVAATPQHGMVRLTAIGDGDRVLFEVHDMGPGVPPSELPLLFDRRAVRRKDTRPKLGRALPLAKSSIEAQDGRLTVESPPGLGTIVRFWLPAAV